MKSREERKVAYNEFNTVIINTAIIFTSEYNSGFRFFHFYWEEKNLWNIYLFPGRFALEFYTAFSFYLYILKFIQREILEENTRIVWWWRSGILQPGL